MAQELDQVLIIVQNTCCGFKYIYLGKLYERTIGHNTIFVYHKEYESTTT